MHSASAYRLLIVISSLFFRFISVRILRKLLDTQTEDMSWFIAILRREGCWYLNWNAFAEINIHLKSARKTARHPSPCDPPCPRKNQTELISWQPGRVSTFRTRDTRGTKHQRGKWKRYFLWVIMKRNCNLRLCIRSVLRGLRWGQIADGADRDMTRNEANTRRLRRGSLVMITPVTWSLSLDTGHTIPVTLTLQHWPGAAESAVLRLYPAVCTVCSHDNHKCDTCSACQGKKMCDAGPGVQWSAQIDDTPPIVSRRHTRPTEVLLLPLPHKPRAPQTCVWRAWRARNYCCTPGRARDKNQHSDKNVPQFGILVLPQFTIIEVGADCK